MDEEPTYLQIDELRPLAASLARIPTLEARELEAEYIQLLGRKQGALNHILRNVVPKLPQAEKVALGQSANRLKQDLEAAFEHRRQELAAAAADRSTAGLDPTMPSRGRWRGAEHPVTRVTDDIVSIFERLGFVRVGGPEAETEWYNFGALNFPPDHPAMDMHDTLYLDVGDRRKPGTDRRVNRTSGVADSHERRKVEAERRKSDEGRVLLRTHTSPVQIRTMLAHSPPIRAVIPGWCYRKDTFDPSHAPTFMQVEGLVVDEGISFVDLKATLSHFARAFFGRETRVRFRPSFFPFTEPSAEMDVSHSLCGGAGCAVCKGTGWIEILGSGMVHPRVLENCGIDPERYTGFAFGMGPHRIALQRHDIPDIRLFFEADMRFLEQFVDGRVAP